MQRIVPCPWFDTRAKEAVKFYTSLIKPSKIGTVTRYGDTGHGPKGGVMTVEFELAGQRYLALNGGPIYKFTPAISFMVACKTQKEIDRLWEKLTEGGAEVECGWLTDKYGMSWQIIPSMLSQWMRDPVKFQRVIQALLRMKKLDIKELKKAYDSKS